MNMLPKRDWPVMAAVVLLLALVATTLLRVLHANDGRLVYALDDAYIHMAMAKNLAARGVLGVTPHGFTAASSSVVWPLLLGACYRITGANQWIPLILNSAFAVLALAVIGNWLRRTGMRPVPAFILLLAVIAFAPLTPLVFTGMEHNLHLCMTLLFARCLWNMLLVANPTRRQGAAVLASAALMTAGRYEGLFMIALAALVLYLEKRRTMALCILPAGAAPVAIFGAFCVLQGWYPLPNSVLLKGTMPGFGSFEAICLSLGMRSVERLFLEPHVVVLVLPAAALLFAAGGPVDANPVRGRAPTALRPMLLLFLGTTLLHLQFAKTGWFLRYEAYLVCLGLTLLGIASAAWGPRLRGRSWYAHAAAAVLALVLLFPLGSRAVWALQNTVRATQNLYQQQYQMALFLRKYYPRGRVVLNDIGAVSYLNGIHILDLSGLASMDLARARREDRDLTEVLRTLARRESMELAVVYKWPFIPEEWTEVARWHIRDNVVCRDDTVSFYAVNPVSRSDLIENLRSFTPYLPPEVHCEVADVPIPETP